MNKVKALALLLACFSFFSKAQAQQDTTVLNNIIEKTQRFGSEYPVEKIYLHFDKPYYAVGDTIWFKGYLTLGQNQPSLLSKIMYVELFTATDSLVQTFKLPVNGGAAYGHIPLNKSHYRHGNYYIRAYTLWMLNFPGAYLFYKNMVIGEAIDRQVLTNIRFSRAADQRVNATITFRDPEGKPYANRSVNWQMITNFDEVNKGKINTDANGVAVIPIALDNKKAPVEDGTNLVTTFIADPEEPPVSASFNLKHLKSTNDLQFFPEGGDLIEAVPTQVAFKGIQSNGLGISVKGSVKDEAGNKIVDFTSQHLGMGAFYLNPEAGKTYTASVTFADGTTANVKLPEVKRSGIAIQANSKLPGNIDVKVISSTAFLDANKGKTFFITAQQNGVIYFAGKAVLQRQLFTLKIAKAKLPEGITQLTLFSDQQVPVSERLVFVKNKNMLNLAIKADKPAYGIKQKVVLTINAKDTANFVASNLSLSVVDETKVPSDEQNEISILSTLLLTSDLQGYIEKPNYYFTKTDDKKLADLDILMLTQGFRRFDYKEILANRFPETKFQPEQSINITGTLRNNTGLPINKGTLLMTIPAKRYNKQLLTGPTGAFVFKDLNFIDSNLVTISAKYNPNPNNLIIMVDGLPEAATGVNKNMADGIQNIDSAITSYLNNSRRQYQGLRTIRAITVTSEKAKRPSHADHSQLSSLSSVPDSFMEGSVFKGCTMFAECIKFRLTGVTFYDNNFFVSRDYNSGMRVPMAIYLNGMPITFLELNTIMPAEVESVEVFWRDALGMVNRANNTNGVVVINTKTPPKNLKGSVSKEDLKKLFPDKFIVSYYPRGYAKEREFYVPKYSVNPAENNFVDLRTTVYWNPKITTDANGNATVEFFNADGKGNYRAVLEGTDANGNLGRTVFRYTVK